MRIYTVGSFLSVFYLFSATFLKESIFLPVLNTSEGRTGTAEDSTQLILCQLLKSLFGVQMTSDSFPFCQNKG